MLSILIAAAVTIQMQPIFQRGLLIEATVQGRPGKFLFDTGGGVTHITPEFAKAIGCKPWGQITGFQMTGPRLDMQRCDNVTIQIGKEKSTRETVGVFDINKYLPADAGRVDGTIALDVFEGRAILFSYSKQSLHVTDAATLADSMKSRKSVPIRIAREASGLALTVNLPVRTGQGTAWFEMDSGNTGSSVLVSKPYARALNLDDTTRDPQPFEASLLDGTKIKSKARALDLILDGNLGITFLSEYDIALDLKNAKAWIVPTGH